MPCISVRSICSHKQGALSEWDWEAGTRGGREVGEKARIGRGRQCKDHVQKYSSSFENLSAEDEYFFFSVRQAFLSLMDICVCGDLTELNLVRYSDGCWCFIY